MQIRFMLVTWMVVILTAFGLKVAEGEESSFVWTTYTTADGLASDSVWAIAPDEQGRVWFGTNAGVSVRLGSRRGLFDGQGWRTYTTAHGLADDWVTAIGLDGQGRVWFGTYGGGVSLFDGMAWRTFNVTNSGLANDWVTAVAIDDKGYIWLGTFGGGLNRTDGEGWQTYNAANSGLANDWVTAMAVGPDGNLWVGTYGGGVARFDGRTWTVYNADNSPLADNYVNAIVADKAGRVWLGTGGGLTLFDGGAWATFTEEDGLADERVNALAVDGEGLLWVGTADGLSTFDGRDWTTYRVGDGLSGNYISAVAVDAAGNLWVGTVGAGVWRYGEGEEAGQPNLPVVLIHGWHGPQSDRVEDSQFRFLKRWLEREGFAVYFATGISADNTLHQNALRLRDVIAEVKEATGAARVNIVAHSMGGLNARAYIESSLYQDDVNALFMLGTPNAGVRQWYGFLLQEIAAGTAEPSALELTPEQMSLFNDTHQNLHQVPYHLIGGDARAATPLLELLPPTDGLVTLGSAHALTGPSGQTIITDDLHGWTAETILADLPSYLWPARTYDLFLRNQLRQGWSEPKPGAVLPPADVDAEELIVPGSEVHTPYRRGSIRPGQVITCTIEIDDNRSVRFLLTWDKGELSINLTDPAGETVVAASKPIGRDMAHLILRDREFTNVAGYLVREASPGPWQVRLNEATEETRYTLYAALDSELVLTVPYRERWYRPGQTAILTTTLSVADSPVPGAQVEGELVDPKGPTQKLIFLDDGEHGDGRVGDGIYGTAFSAPGEGGYYPLFLKASGQWAGHEFGRGQELLIAVSPETATLTGQYDDQALDDDGDGQYDLLLIEVGVEVKQERSLAVAVSLADANGVGIGRTVTPFSASAGVHQIEVPFPGQTIHDAAVDGPYLVRQVILVDIEGAAIKLEEAHNVHLTQGYSRADFVSRSEMAQGIEG